MEAGDKVAGVECMKMLNDIETPAGGVIRYRVKLGQVIAQNDVVADVS